MDVLITGARAPAALELVRAFSGAGHRVFTADSQQPTLAASSRYVSRNYLLPSPRLEPIQFATVLENLAAHVDLIIPTCEETFYVAYTAQHSTHRPKFFVDSLDQLGQLHHKFRFIEMLKQLGLQAPNSRLITNPRDLKVSQKSIAKPVFSRFATQTQVLLPGHPAPFLPVSAANPWVLQSFIEGSELCSYSVAKKGRLTAHAVYQPEWRAGRGASVYFRPADYPQVRQFVETVVAHLGFTGQISFDFIHNAQGLWPIECNPRATSGLHLLNHEALVNAFLGTGASQKWGSQEINLGLPMLVLALPEALKQGRLAKWWQDWSRAKDAVWSLEDPKPAFQQLIGTAFLAHSAYQNKVGLLEATTADIEWNGDLIATHQSPIASAGVASLVRQNPAELVTGLKTQLIADHNGSVPISIQTTQQSNSYIASSYTHYISYAQEELATLKNSIAEAVLGPILNLLGKWLRFTQIDDTVYINNWLVSTCLYPKLSLGDVRDLTQTLSEQFPTKALVWRSVHGHGDDTLKRSLVACGYKLIPSRSVLFYDTTSGIHHTKRDFKNDLKLLKNSPYSFRKLEPHELERVLELYNLLYLEKHSYFNPQYTLSFLKFAYESGFLEFYGLAESGRVDAAMGFYSLNGYMAAPIFGYDTALPQDLGLYRLLSAYLTLEAEKRYLVLHASSGAAGFKRSRGAIPEIEWLAVLDRHLPLCRRLGWQSLDWLMNGIALPVIRRMGL
jgi:hypothetical protein